MLIAPSTKLVAIQQVRGLASSLGYCNTTQLGSCCRLRTQVVDSRYPARITPIDTVDKLVDQSRCISVMWELSGTLGRSLTEGSNFIVQLAIQST